MVRVFVVYEQEPESERYARHVELCRQVPRAVFLPNMETFEATARTPELAATGKDAMEMGIPFKVHFAEVG